MHGDRSMEMRKGLNQSMMGVRNEGTTYASVHDSCQCQFEVLAGIEISNVQLKDE